MSLRAIWIISLSKNEFGNILLYRRFPTIERKCKATYGKNYVGLPSASIFASNLLVKLQLTDSKQFVDWRDKANNVMQRPIIELIVNNETIWPIVSITQGSYLACCLPFVENFQSVEKDNLLKIPSISIGFAVLLGILNIFDTSLNTEQRQNKLIDLDNFLSLTMPFGATLDVDLIYASSLIKHPAQKFSKKQPAWKPVEYRGKQLLHIKVSEFVRCVQSDQAGSICHFETFGQVSVKADLEGSVRDVSLSVNSADQVQPLLLDSVVIHPCVTIPGSSFLLGTGLPKRLRFSPPAHEFVLFHYRSLVPEDPPIQGIFKMVGEHIVELAIQLKLDQRVKNSFDFCDLILVFFNRGPVKNSEINVNHGNPKVLEDKYTLKWNIGSKFPKDLEVVLTAKLEFHEGPLLPNSDPFCVDKNCYFQLNFRQSNTTLSGCNIDPKSITFSEGSKPKIVIDRSVQSAEYRIWNKYGDLPFATNLINKFENLFQ